MKLDPLNSFGIRVFGALLEKGLVQSTSTVPVVIGTLADSAVILRTFASNAEESLMKAARRFHISIGGNRSDTPNDVHGAFNHLQRINEPSLSDFSNYLDSITCNLIDDPLFHGGVIMSCEDKVPMDDPSGIRTRKEQHAFHIAESTLASLKQIQGGVTLMRGIRFLVELALNLLHKRDVKMVAIAVSGLICNADYFVAKVAYEASMLLVAQVQDKDDLLELSSHLQKLLSAPHSSRQYQDIAFVLKRVLRKCGRTSEA